MEAAAVEEEAAAVVEEVAAEEEDTTAVLAATVEAGETQRATLFNIQLRPGSQNLPGHRH